MENIIKQYKKVKKQIVKLNTILKNIENWQVPELEKIQERIKTNRMLNECEADLKLVLAEMIKQGGDELSKLCLVDAYAA